MFDYKMKLTSEEKAILDGKKGDTLRKVLESVVWYGEIFGADRLIDITHGSHLVTSFGIPMLTPVFDLMDELIKAGLSTSQPFTVDPRPLDFENVKVNLLEKLIFSKVMYSKQASYEKQLKKVGLKDDNAFSCTCYMEEVGNIPKYGDIISWAESSAVVYANSVIGARCNRNSGIIELLCAIVGKVPNFGLLTDEGRKADWVVEIKTSKTPEAQVLGSAIGMKVVEDVPYIVGLDKFLGDDLTDDVKSYLKDMGAASASNGAVGLYHVDNLTPEAKALKKSLLKENVQTYTIDDAELDRIEKGYPNLWKKDGSIYKAFIGCPHLSLSQVKYWNSKIEESLKSNNKEKVVLDTVMTCAPDVLNKVKEDKVLYNSLLAKGLHLSSICPLMYMNNPLCQKRRVVTNSNKLRTYTTARYFKDDVISNLVVTGRIK